MAFDTDVEEMNPKQARVISIEGHEIVRPGYSDPVEVNRHTATRDGVAGRMSERMLTHPAQGGNERQNGPGVTWHGRETMRMACRSPVSIKLSTMLPRLT
jgi:hypothetical protein